MMRFATRTKELVEEAADSLQQQPHQGERRRAPALPARPRLLLLPPRVAALDEEQAKATLSEQLALENSPTFSPLSDDDQSMDTKNTMTSSTPTSTTPIAAPYVYFSIWTFLISKFPSLPQKKDSSTTVTLISPPTESVVRQLLIQTLEAAEPAAAAVNDGAKMKIQQKSTTLKDVDIKGDKKKKRRREFFTPSRSVIGEDFEVRFF